MDPLIRYLENEALTALIDPYHASSTPQPKNIGINLEKLKANKDFVNDFVS
jgi:hypothetical protein